MSIVTWQNSFMLYSRKNFIFYTTIKLANCLWFVLKSTTITFLLITNNLPQIQVFKGAMSFAYGDYVRILIAAWYTAGTLKANYGADFIGEGKWPAKIINYSRAYGPYHYKEAILTMNKRILTDSSIWFNLINQDDRAVRNW